MQEVLRLVRIEQLANDFPTSSQGRSNAALARALVGQPRVLCSMNRCRIWTRSCAKRCVSSLHICNTLGITVMYVTHDREDADALANRTVQMRAGRIVEMCLMFARHNDDRQVWARATSIASGAVWGIGGWCEKKRYSSQMSRAPTAISTR